jgi:4a-hydroxytetrahydrobiopterin dehydratase
MDNQVLTQDQINEKLDGLEGWTHDLESGKLVSGFEFENFSEAIEFMNAIAEIAEAEAHHPDILVHDYKFVTIFISSHDSEGITQKDFELVNKIEKEMQASL